MNKNQRIKKLQKKLSKPRAKTRKYFEELEELRKLILEDLIMESKNNEKR